MIPDYWQKFVDTYGIVGKTFEIYEEIDGSGVGAGLTILTAAQSIDEATNCWPGIRVSGDGFVPVTSCDVGSGDYYPGSLALEGYGVDVVLIFVGRGPSGWRIGGEVDWALKVLRYRPK